MWLKQLVWLKQKDIPDVDFGAEAGTSRGETVLLSTSMSGENLDEPSDASSDSSAQDAAEAGPSGDEAPSSRSAISVEGRVVLRVGAATMVLSSLLSWLKTGPRRRRPVGRRGPRVWFLSVRRGASELEWVELWTIAIFSTNVMMRM